MRQELTVSTMSANRAFDRPTDFKAARPHLVQNSIQNWKDFCIGKDAPDERFPPCFVVRFDQRDYIASALSDQATNIGQHSGLRGPAGIDSDQIDRLRKSDVHRVGPFHDHHPRIPSELPGKRSVRRINRIDLFCASLQEAVDETADVASEIRANHAMNVEGKGVQGCGELLSSTRNVLHRLDLGF